MPFDPTSQELANPFEEGTPKWRRRNLERLASYLASAQTDMRFHMGIFCRDETAPSSYESSYTGEPLEPSRAECGTVGCALGHGPFATGIRGKLYEGWGQYALRVFGIDPCDGRFAEGDWEFLFSVSWAYIAPSPMDAADQIVWFLDHGAPTDFCQTDDTEWRGYFLRSGRLPGRVEHIPGHLVAAV